MQPAVSVIIPVYETAPYLRRCLDSVCGQTLRDIEILCVNDASPDNALEILREYAAKDSRITVIDFSRNLGVSAARNAAIAIARGEYLGFVDSDDAIDTQFYEKLYAKAQETSALIVKGARQRILEDGTKVVQPLNDKVRLNKLAFTHQWTTAIYQTAFIRNNGINCPLGVRNLQDVAFLYKAISIVPDVVIVDEAWYYYYARSNSATMRQFDDKTMRSHLQSLEDIIAFLNLRKIDEDVYDNIFEKTISRCLEMLAIKKFVPDSLDDIAFLCAETAIRLYATCVRPAVLHGRLVAKGKTYYSFFLTSADVAGLTRVLKTKPADNQKKAAMLRKKLQLLQS